MMTRILPRFSNQLRALGIPLILFLAVPATASDTNLVYFSEEHVDIRIQYTPENETNRLDIVVRNKDAGRSYASNEVILVVKESARLTLPEGTPFGNGGDDFWVLPQSQSPDLLYIGFSGEGVPPGIFAAPLELFLRSVQGPGNFFAWQATGIGMLDIKMNTADGITDADKTTPLSGGHEHMNFGFSTSGVYRVTFQAAGQRLGDSTNSLSAETTFTFHVLPLPPEMNTPFAQWQAQHWPAETPDNVKGAEADPDADGIVNLMEYALGLDPKSASGNGLPSAHIVTVNGQQHGALGFQRNKSATDLAFVVQVSDSLQDGTWQNVEDVSEIIDGTGTEQLTVRDTVAVDAAPMRFYRLRISFKP